ncbi:hypothetical protein MC7420_6465 [Coleofasciculus chthonoplastes PCC 7420]|uniref:Uncharacterized protein n=1 Tax=Coleofasciculus chthonoplastes PCC 7420 TaxID=118168 RepID=B4VQU3_9CYAN|nr:hypothetical protein MC7420_6465 [Coleofasciculus chthonoplastes PCC 7420]
MRVASRCPHTPGSADGETRTRKAYATRPSSVRVYQFHHIRMANLLYQLF